MQIPLFSDLLSAKCLQLARDYQWELLSGGCCQFLFAVERDVQGRNVFKQVAHKLA